MPYITQERREALDPLVRSLDASIHTEGELHYVITRLCQRWLRGIRSYAGYNAVIGVLECAKQEFYRRAVALYEDEKRGLNGDVY